MPGAFLFREKAYPKAKGAQAEVAAVYMAIEKELDRRSQNISPNEMYFAVWLDHIAAG
jgi:hypothetical protein